MPYKYSVVAGYPLEETGEVKYDSISYFDLLSRNNAGRRLAKHHYGTNFETFQDWVRDTRIQSAADVLNYTTFTTWLWFDCDVSASDFVLLGRGTLFNPIWSVRAREGRIVFEIGHRAIVGPTILQGQHFVCVSYDNATMEMMLYYDGVVVAIGSCIMSSVPTGVAYGSYVDGGQPFNGWIDSALWTCLVLDITDIDNIYNAPDGRDIPWFFDPTIFENFCIIDRDKVLLLERQCIEEPIEREKTGLLERDDTDIVERNKFPVIEGQHQHRNRRLYNVQ